MPLMSGQVMINHIREYEKSLNIPKPVGIIVTTGDPSENEKMSCLNLGANDFLTKPIRINHIGESLKKLFSESNLKQEIHQISDTTILIVDDDSFASDIMKRYIQDLYHVIQAYSYEQVTLLFNISQILKAFSLYKDAYARISLILLDSQIGTAQGAALAKNIRHFEGRNTNSSSQINLENTNKFTPIISISGYSIERQKQDYQNLQISEFLRKPISKKSMIPVISQVINS
jgi:CheY-like chemotaxis protein